MSAGLLAIAVRTAIVLVALFVGLRVFGREPAGEGRVDGILLMLLLGNAVQNAMTAGSGQLEAALVSASVLIAIGWASGAAFRRSPTLQRRVEGTPTVLVLDGKVIRRNLRRERLTDEEVMESIRSQGLARLADVKLGVHEPNGAITIVPREAKGERR